MKKRKKIIVFILMQFQISYNYRQYNNFFFNIRIPLKNLTESFLIDEYNKIIKKEVQTKNTVYNLISYGIIFLWSSNKLKNAPKKNKNFFRFY